MTNHRLTSPRPAPRPQCLCHPGNWFNPRRRGNAERLIQYIAWHARKVHLDEHFYGRIQEEHGLDQHQADLAVDDLFTLGLIDMPHGGRVAILLSDDIDAAAGRPAGRLA